MLLKSHPAKLKGTLRLPPSKSHTMRALLFGAMGKGKTIIHEYLKSPDTTAMIEGLSLMGVKISVRDESIEIEGVDRLLCPSENVIDAKNSGQVLRFLAAFAALNSTYTVITGDASIRHNRPVEPLLSALNQLNCFAVSSRLDGKAPIIIKGPLQPGFAVLSGSDSQPVSALLMAACFLKGTTILRVFDAGEKPWINLTLSWIKKLGGKVSHQDYREYKIEGPLSYNGFEVTIPGDFSSAAFPLAAAVITSSKITIENIDMKDIQGDKIIVAILRQMGASFEIDDDQKTLHVNPTNELKGLRIDANDCIDAVPLLAVIGCFASGKTEIVNAAIARHKESDRIHCITIELKKMGAKIEELADGLIVYQSPLKGAILSSHEDHRIAMALSIASMGAQGETTIDGVECISKSYPGFIETFQNLGVKFE